MFKKFLSYILVMLMIAGTSCSDNLDFIPVNEITPDGDVTFTLSVPRINSVVSRHADPEFNVDDITMLVYTGEGSNVSASQIEQFHLTAPNTPPNRIQELTGNQLQLTFRLKKGLRNKTDLRFYFIANCGSAATLSLSTTENSLKTSPVTSIGSIDGNGALIMSGQSSYSDIINQVVVPVYRNGAKVTVSNIDPTDNPEGLEFYHYALFGQATQSTLLAGVTGSTATPGTSSPAQNMADLTETAPTYFPSTTNSANANAAGGKIYLIVKADYNDGASSKSYFYRLDFAKKDASGNVNYLSALPNHWYQFVITGVTGPGYDTPAEAALHPENAVVYDIHDHSPVSFNMISDGVRELGVSHAFTYSSDASDGDVESDEPLYIRFFSKYAGDLPANASAVKAMLSLEDDSWLHLSDPEKVDDPDLLGKNPSDDPNDVGVIYKVTLKYLHSNQLGTLYNSITVKWQGLERKVPVTWVRDFNGASITSCTLTMTGSPIDGGVKEIDDYWAFLNSTNDFYNPEGSGEVSGTGNLWGVQPVANNGKVRNQGFHFPVMNGKGSNDADFATYSYILTFDKDARFNSDNGAFTPTVTKTGDPGVVNYCVCEVTSTKPLTITIKRKGRATASDYAYATGRMIVSIVFTADSKREVYAFDLYHTGFFQKDSQQYRLDEQDSGNYYYYEVAPVTVDGGTRYILDRNLGAKSAQDCIIDNGDVLITGSLNARGGYYTVAKQDVQYEDPKIYTDVAPAGYGVPTKDFWDGIRVSSQFHTESDGRYFPAYYDTGNAKIGKVYFPKAMMTLNNSLTGDVRSGYYWTTTPSSGTEKDEIGRWLNMFILSGSSTSFANGYVSVGDNWSTTAFGASVRCVNDIEEVTTVQRVNFNVSGATHVCLYVEDDEQVRTYTSTWPGHSIGNYATMGDGIWMGFSFATSQFSPDKLRVLFNYVDELGVIHTYSQAPDGSTRCTTDLKPSECVGWKVIGDQSPAIVPPSSITTMDNVVLSPAPESALGNWWLCENGATPDGSTPTGTPHVYDYEKGEARLTTYRIYWSENQANSDQVHVWVLGVPGGITDYNTGGHSEGVENGYRYFTFKSDAATNKQFGFKFHSSTSNGTYIYDNKDEFFVNVSLFTPDEEGNEPFCAYFNGSTFHSGKPQPPKSYRIYWPISKGTNISVRVNGQNLEQADNIKMNEVIGYYSVDFETGEGDGNLLVSYPTSGNIVDGVLDNIIPEDADGQRVMYLNYSNQSVVGTPVDIRASFNATHPIESGKKRIWMTNCLLWENVRIWYFKDGTTLTGTTWPNGKNMNLVENTDNSIWYYDVPTETNGLLFLDPSNNKTGDKSVPANTSDIIFYN